MVWICAKGVNGVVKSVMGGLFYTTTGSKVKGDKKSWSVFHRVYIFVARIKFWFDTSAPTAYFKVLPKILWHLWRFKVFIVCIFAFLRPCVARTTKGHQLYIEKTNYAGEFE